MIIVNQYIEELQKAKDAGYGELPVIFSSDAEGNSYYKVENFPGTFLVEDINVYELETDFEYDENGNVIEFEPNCIIIN